MRKLMLILPVILFVLVGAVIALRSQGGVTQLDTNGQQAEKIQEMIMTPQTAAGSYVSYSGDALSRSEGTRILFFHASWCPQCRALEADIKKSGVPAGTTIFKVDYDNAQDLRKKYGVTLQTTVVKVDESGNLISKFTPYQKPTLQNALENL